MDLIYTLLFIVVGYFVYYKLIKPHLLEGGTVRTKINKKENSDTEYVDYEEVED